MSRNFDALKSPLQGFLGYNSRFVPPARWITFSGVPSTLTNFPVLVKAVEWQNVANGYDVHFQDSSGNELPFDLDWYDDSSKSGAWWVKVPTLTSGTSIKMLYGEAGRTTDQSSPETVWADYYAVYHFNEIPTGTITNKADGNENAIGGSGFTFIEGLGGTGRALKWYTAGTSASDVLTTQLSTALTSSNRTSMCVMHDRSYPSGTFSIPLFQPAEQKVFGGDAFTGDPAYGLFDCMQSQSREVQCYCGMSPHNSGVTGPVAQKLRYVSHRFQERSFRYSQLDDVEGSAGNTDIYSGNEFVGNLKFYSFTSFWKKAIYPVVDELRLRKTGVSADWATYEYQNIMLHDNYTTYSGEVR